MSQEQGTSGPGGLAKIEAVAAGPLDPPPAGTPAAPAAAGIASRSLGSWSRFRHHMPLAALIVQRLGLSLVLLWAVSVVVFLGIEALPGDFAETYLGQSATPQAVANIRQELGRSEEHKSELQSLMRISYAVFCLK